MALAAAATPATGSVTTGRGGNPIHALLDWGIAEILALAGEWGPVDRSHRKLAHRGSYLERVCVAPSTVRRVLAGHDVDLPAPARPGLSPASASRGPTGSSTGPGKCGAGM